MGWGKDGGVCLIPIGAGEGGSGVPGHPLLLSKFDFYPGLHETLSQIFE